jgi:hypothetical protein
MHQLVTELRNALVASWSMGFRHLVKADLERLGKRPRQTVGGPTPPT